MLILHIFVDHFIKAKKKQRDKNVKIATFQSNNIYSALKLDDPGNSPQVSISTLGRSEQKTKSSPKVLKGGAKNASKAIEMNGIFDFAIRVAESHGIKVTPDIPNAAQGNCLFDSILDNINHRPNDFSEKLEDEVDCYRELEGVSP